MGTTQPIRDQKELEYFRDYYKNVKPSKRNYALVVFGLNSALRISDILNLRWRDVYDFRRDCFKDHVSVWEMKNNKKNTFALNRHAIEALADFKATRKVKPADFVFTKSTNLRSPICRQTAFRIIKRVGLALHNETISCHSMRKTFGYYAWKNGAQPALLMDIYNHSSYQVTKRYLGIDQDEKDEIFYQMNLWKTLYLSAF